MQPPTIPHQIDHYQVDRYANKCLTCHSRHRVQEAHERYLEGDGPDRRTCIDCHKGIAHRLPEMDPLEGVESFVE